MTSLVNERCKPTRKDRRLARRAEREGRAAKRAEEKLRKRGVRIEQPVKRKDMKRYLGYDAMFRDGVCKVEEGYYSTTITWDDVSYQDARQSEKEEIFEGWEAALNTLDPATDVQLTFLSKKMTEETFASTMFLPLDDDERKNRYRSELNGIIADEIARGQHDMERHRWVTLSQACKDHAEAARDLGQARDAFLRDIADIGSDGEKLTGPDRLNALYAVLHPDEGEIAFDYNELLGSALSTHDFIAPSTLDREGTRIRFGEWIGQALVVESMVRSVKDTCLSDFVRMPFNMLVSLHIRPVEQADAIEFVSLRETDLKADKAQKLQRNAAKMIFSEEMLPPQVNQAIDNASDLRDDLQNKDQHMFKLTTVLFPFAKDEEELKANVEQVKKLGRRHSMRISAPAGMQRAGFKSALPLGKNWVPIERQLTTAPLAALVPFTSEELIQPGGGYYGLNQLSGNPILFGRRSTASPNGWIVGKPGRGKSYAAKQAIMQDWLSDRFAYFDIIDPEREFTPICGACEGQVVHISAASDAYVNPFDLDMYYSDDDEPLQVKMEFILSLVGFMAGALSAKQKSIVDRVVRMIYQPFFASGDKADLPILSDMHAALLEQAEAEAHDLAVTIERYVNGTMRVFNHHTNIDLDNRMIVWDIKDLGKDMRSVGLLVVLDQIWNRITANRERGVSSYFYVDEWQLLLGNDYAVKFFDELWSRARKWGAIPTAITQNVARVKENELASKMLSNSDFLLLLGQSDADARVLESMFALSGRQMKYLRGKRRKPGSGLLFAEDRVIPFVNRYPETSELHKLFDTKFKVASDFGAYGIDVARGKAA